MKVLDTLIDKVSNSFLNYLHLGNWLDQKLTNFMSQRDTKAFNSLESFWDNVKNEILHNGDVIKFSEMFISEWIPKQPGQLWTQKRLKGPSEFTLESLKKGDGFLSHGNIDVEKDHFGVVRMPFGTSAKHFSILSFTSIDSWCCDLGVPLIVSRSVYDQFLRRKISNNSVVADFKGILRVAKIPIVHPDLIKSLGSDIKTDFINQMMTPSGITNLYIEVISPLDISFRYHDSHPPGFLWAIDRETRNATVTHNIDTQETTVTNCEPFISYGLRLCHTNLNDLDEIHSVVESFKKGTMYVEGKTSKKLNQQNYGLLSRDVLTEFDARKKYFNTSLQIAQKPWEDTIRLEEIKRILIDLGIVKKYEHNKANSADAKKRAAD